jgi:hypothetical protein
MSRSEARFLARMLFGRTRTLSDDREAKTKAYAARRTKLEKAERRKRKRYGKP